jgi:hypothetical protein
MLACIGVSLSLSSEESCTKLHSNSVVLNAHNEEFDTLPLLWNFPLPLFFSIEKTFKVVKRDFFAHSTAQHNTRDTESVVRDSKLNFYYVCTYTSRERERVPALSGREKY